MTNAIDGLAAFTSRMRSMPEPSGSIRSHSTTSGSLLWIAARPSASDAADSTCHRSSSNTMVRKSRREASSSMMSRFTAAILVLVALTMSAAEKQRGMSYACAFSRERDVRYGSPASAEALRDLKKLGGNWASIMPFGFHRGTEIRFGGEHVWETDDSLVAVTKQAHELGHGLAKEQPPADRANHTRP